VTAAAPLFVKPFKRCNVEAVQEFDGMAFNDLTINFNASTLQPLKAKQWPKTKLHPTSAK
jgi:hypothetical protein